MRIYPTDDEARRNGGLVCPAHLPKPGTKVDIAGIGRATVLGSQPALPSALYGVAGSQLLPPGFDCGCTLQVEYADGTRDVISAAENPPISDGVATAVLATTAAAVLLAGESGQSRYGEMKQRYDEALSRDESPMVDPPLNTCAEVSGEYWGGSEESDAGDQAIRVHLRLESGGRITGRGRDNVDGSYQIVSGRWTARPDGRRVQLAWKESYDEGFSAICIGSYDATSGKIDAEFVSSRDVSGTFTLAKKPAIF